MANTELKIRISGDLGNLQEAFDRLNASLGRLSGEAERVSQRSTQSFSRIRQAIGGIGSDQLRQIGENLRRFGQQAQQTGQQTQTALSPLQALLARIRGGLAAVNAELVRTGQAAARAGAQARTGLGPLGGVVQQVRGEIVALATAYAGLQGFLAFASAADQAATLNARLRLATSSQEEFNRAYDETFAIAQRTRTGLQATVELYARLERSTRDLGLNQSTLLALTETINQAAQLSGGGASADAALFQLSQGLASGQLRGEELNSVLEQTPRLAQAIADGLNIPIGRLRELASQGRLTAAEISRALLASRGQIAAEFSELPLTIRGAFTQLQNAFVRFISDSEGASGAAADIAAAISTIAENLPAIASAIIAGTKVLATYLILFRLLPAVYTAAAGAAASYAASLAAVAAATTAAQAATLRFVTFLRGAAALVLSAVAGWQIGAYLREQFLEVELFGIALVRGVLVLFERMKTGVILIFGGVVEAVIGAINFLRERVAQIAENLATIIDATNILDLEISNQVVAKIREIGGAIGDTESAWDRFNSAAQLAIGETEAAVDEINENFDALADAAINRRFSPAAAAGDVVSPDGNGGGVGAAAAADQNAILADQIQFALAQLQRLYDAGELGLRDYFAARQALLEQAIDIELENARAQLASAENADQQSAALTRIIQLTEERGRIGVRTAQELADAERALQTELANIETQLLALSGQTAEARARELEAQYAQLLTRLQAQGDVAGQELVRRLINVEAAQARFDELEGVTNDRIADLRSAEASISAQVEAGLLTQTEGERQLQAVRQNTIVQLQQQRQALVDLAATADTAVRGDILRAIQELDTEILTVQASTQQLANQIREAGANAIGGALRSIATGAATAGEAMRQLALDFAASLAQIASQALAQRATDAIAGLFGGGGQANPGQAAAAGAAYAAPVQAAGVTLATAGGVVTTAAGALAVSAAALQAAATTLLIANSASAVGVAHSGAKIGAGFPARRNVPGWVFSGAPRYHSGGVAGLKPDEVPAILQTGERVLSREQTAAFEAGGRPAPGYRIVNITDPSMMADYLESAEGEEVVLNVIARNPGRVQQVLGG